MPDDIARFSPPPRPPALRHGTPTCRLVRWEPVANPSALIGRATIGFAGGWVVSSIPVFRSADSTLSAGTPSIPLLASDGTHLRDAAGKRRYLPVITFETSDARARWNAAVLGALREGGIR